jgi:hypothetical protein
MTTIKTRLAQPLAFIFGALALVAVTQIADASHPRPKGATPIRVALVPAFKQCTSPNSTHGPPLAFPSCNPPVQASDFLTVGSPDANGAGANSVGFVQLDVKVGAPGPPDDSEVLIKASITDVRCKPGTAASVCSGANAADGPDYSGALQGNATVRISDHFNGPNGTDAATVQDIPFPISLSCSNTADTSVGGTCSIPDVQCLGCPPPKEGVRTVAELTQIRIIDGGADGNPYSQPEDNTLFAVQGIFIP